MIERPTLPRRRADTRHRPWRLLLLAAFVMVPGAHAFAAGGPPRLDTAGMCEATMAASPADPGLGECVAAERRALAYLQAAYPAVPPRVRDRCERLSRKRSMGFGSYAFIQGCLDLK